MRKWIMILLVVFLLPASAFASGERLFWTQDGYRRVAINGKGHALLLGLDLELADGIALNRGASISLLDENTSSLWSHTVGGNGEEKLEQSIAAKDGWLMAGASSSSDLSNGWHVGYYDEYEARADGWAIRMDDAGDILWTRCYGGSDSDVFYGLCEAWDGGYILVGETYSSDGDVVGWHDSGEQFTQPDGWIVQIDENGQLLWSRALGGSGHDTLYGVSQVEGGYLVVGTTNSEDGDVSGLHGDRDGWVALLDTEGNLIRQACYGGGDEDRFVSISEGPGGFLAVGHTWSDTEMGWGCDGWAVALDAGGEMQWSHRFGSKEMNHSRYAAWSINEHWLIAGYTQIMAQEENNHWIVTIDPQGEAWSLLRGEF